jgi:hypothetical protein
MLESGYKETSGGVEPLLPRDKGSNVHIINGLAPLPWERGWGEVNK